MQTFLSLSHYCHHFDWYPLSKVWPLFVVGWWFHKDDNDDYDDDIVGAKGSTQRDELPRDDDVTGLVGKYHQRPPSYSITKMITVLDRKDVLRINDEGAGGNSTVLIHLELKSLLDYRAEVDQSGHHDQLGQVVKVS